MCSFIAFLFPLLQTKSVAKSEPHKASVKTVVLKRKLPLSSAYNKKAGFIVNPALDCFQKRLILFRRNFRQNDILVFVFWYRNAKKLQVQPVAKFVQQNIGYRRHQQGNQ